MFLKLGINNSKIILKYFLLTSLGGVIFFQMTGVTFAQSEKHSQTQKVKKEERSENERDDILEMIKATQQTLLDEAFELVQGNIKIIQARKAPSWNEEEGDDGNMKYDIEVAKEEEEDADLYRYLNLLEAQDSDDSVLIGKNISKISEFIRDLKAKNIKLEQCAENSPALSTPESYLDLWEKEFSELLSFNLPSDGKSK